MKKSKILLVVALFSVATANASIGEGFGKVWDGIKDVASGMWDTISSPFRSKEDTEVKDKKSKKHYREEK